MNRLSPSQSNSNNSWASALIVGAAAAVLVPPVADASNTELAAHTIAVQNPRAETNANLKKSFSLNIASNRLEDVLNAFSSATGQSIEALWSTNGSQGLDRDLVVSLPVKNLSLQNALEALSRTLMASEVTTTWQVLADGTLQFGTKESLNKFPETKIYDVKDLLTKVPDYPDAPQIDLNQALQSNRGGGGGAGPFRDNQQGTPPREPTRDRSVEELQQLIMDLVEPDQWKDHGGSGASIHVFNGSFIVQAPPYIHRGLQ